METNSLSGTVFQAVISPYTLTSFAIIALVYYFTIFRANLRAVRTFSQDWPGLSHDSVWGHMKAIGDYVKGDKHFDFAMTNIWKNLDRPPFIMMDSWPLTRPNVIAITDAELAESLSKATPQQPYSWPKSPVYADLRHLFSSRSITRVHGEEWRLLRKKYGPGFNSKHLQGLLPELIQEVKVFMQKLDDNVNNVITLGELTTSLTIDIICAVVFGHSIGAQTRHTPLTIGFQGCIEWQLQKEKINPFHIFNPLRPLMLGYYERMLNTAIDSQISDAFSNREKLNQRSIIALTIGDDEPSPKVIGKARDQIKAFLLAGHDTTSTFLQYLYYELHKNPEILSKIRAEHKAIFGSEQTGYHERVQEMFINQPDQVMQKMPYTTMVMKETLRYHTIASGSKFAPKGSGLSADYKGKSYCLDEHTLHLVSAAYHEDPKYWGPDANDFNPDRWLEGAEWKVSAFAFRPFERGPRACIAQEFVYLEAKVILAFTVNTFEFEKVFDTKYKELYSVRKITAKPNDGMRMRVKRVN